MVTDVINYHRHDGSSVYMCMLDASKAFDRVNVLTLLNIVLKGNVPHLFEAIDENLRRVKHAHQMEQHRY